MTIRTGEEFLNSPPLKTDVCIVGTGPAGITLAWHIKKKYPKLDVTLLEGSRLFGRVADSTLGYNTANGLAYNWNENEALYDGVTQGLMKQNEEEFLIRPPRSFISGPKERERIYGGTSTHWGAQSRPLDAITFIKRAGFSGWPIPEMTWMTTMIKHAVFVSSMEIITLKVRTLGTILQRSFGLET
ncbi:MAG: NAD(P)-binding protein [Arenicella sp.]|nr:NAD(P)-binding protein [Arenicella sp.]